MAARFGYIAVKALLEGKKNVAVGIWKGEYTYTPLTDAVKKVPKVDPIALDRALDQKGYFLRIDIDDEENNLLNIERKRLGLQPLEEPFLK